MMKHKISHLLALRLRGKNKSAQAGNIFFMLFASIALVAAFAVGANNLTKGLVSSMSDVTRKTIAEERMTTGARLVFQNPVEANAATADCDNDGFVEPLGPRVFGSSPHPVNGGLVPINIGATTKDPWGTEYGYCAWDAGTSQCPATTIPRLLGTNNPSDTVVAVISAGKDRKFSTTCNPIGGGSLSPASCTGLGDSSYNDASTGHCYYNVHASVTQPAAQASCGGNGAYLVAISSSAESSVVFSHFGDTSYWMGIDDSAVEGNWQYSYGEKAGTVFWTGGSSGGTGSTVAGQYSNWYPNEAGDGVTENCALLNYGSRGNNWTDIGCGTNNSYICEKTGGTSAPPLPADCSAQGPDYYNDPVSGHCYFHTITQGDIAYGTAQCTAAGAYVVAITSAGEEAMIDAHLPHFASFIGGSDAASEGVWKYTGGEVAGQQFWQGDNTGSAVGGHYTNWDPSGEPNNSYGHENCALKYYNGLTTKWFDSVCEDPSGVICEKDPPIPPPVQSASGSDDIIMKYNYKDISGIGGNDLWQVNSTLANTATIEKNINVTGANGSTFDGSINLLKDGLLLPTDATSGTCTVGGPNEESLRLNSTTSPISLEICHAGAWVPISVGGATAVASAAGYDPTLRNCTTANNGPFVPATLYTPPGNYLYELTTTQDGKLVMGSDIGLHLYSNTAGVLAPITPDGSTREDIALRWDKYIFIRNPFDNYVKAYTTNGSTWTLAATVTVNGPEGVSTDGKYFYVTRGSNGVDAFTFNGTAFTLKGHYATAGNSWTSYSDGTYLYVANDNGLFALTFNGTTFTLKGTFNSPVSNAVDVTGDGKYIYVAQYVQDVYALTFNGSTFTVAGTLDGMQGGTDHIFTDGAGHVFFNNDLVTGYGLQTLYAATFNGSTFTIVGNYKMPDNIKGIWSDGTYIYAQDYGDAIALGGFACTAASPPIPIGAAVHLPFDETSGTTALDTASINDATLVNGATFGSGKFGNAAIVDATNDRINVANESNFDWGWNEDFTTAGWFYRNASGSENDLWGKCDSAGGYGGFCAFITDTTEHFAFNVNGSGSIFAEATAPSIGAWHHYAAVYTGSAGHTGAQIKLYIDGVPQTPTTAGGTITGFTLNNVPLTVGYYDLGGGYSLNGKADEFVAYHRALSDAEILQLYNAKPTISAVPSTPAAPGAGAQDCTGLGSDHYNDPVSGHCYYRTAATNTWINQKAACETGGAYLAAITSDTERQMLSTNVSLADVLFIGASDLGNEGVWQYNTGDKAGAQFWQGAASGSAVNGQYSYWNAAQPDNSGGAENCAAINTSGKWGDYPCSSTPLKALCEKGGYSPPKGMIGWWKFDELSGTTAGDSSGNGLVGTLMNGASFGTGKDQNGIVLDGASAYVNMGTPAALTDTIKSTCAWIKPNAQTGVGYANSIFDKGDDNTVGWNSWLTYGSPAKFGSGNDGGLAESNNVVSANQWHFICGTWGGNYGDANDYKIYLDGVSLTPNTSYPGASASDSAYKFVIGAGSQGTNSYFSGKIDEAMVFGRALTAAEVANLYDFSKNAAASFGADNMEPNAAVVIAANQYKGKLGVGDDQNCAIKPDSSLWCSGVDATYFQLGNGATITANQTSLSRVADSAPFTSVSSGYRASCAIKGDATGWCWGDASNGKLGNGLTTPNQPAPVAISGGYLWSQISMGVTAACGIRNDGLLYCWGADTNGMLGNGAGAATTTPGASSDLDSWVAVSVGQDSACGIKTNGSLWCWGHGNRGQVGNGGNNASYQSPVPIIEPGPWTSVTVGNQFACATKLDGSAWCWGGNTNGTLGLGGYYADSLFPGRVNDNGPWLEVFTGVKAQTVCGIKMDGTAWCWGSDGADQMGNGSGNGAHSTPTPVLNPGPWATMGMGTDYICGIQIDGSAWCAGSDTNGRLANGAAITGTQTSMTRVANFPTVAPFTWDDTGTVLSTTGTANIAMGTNSALSYDGSFTSGVPNGLRFDTGGQTVLRQTASTTSSWSPPTGLLGWWKFDETSGTTAADSSGNGNSGALIGDTTFVAGKNGNAITVDGAGDYVNMGSPAAFNNSILSMCAWINQATTLPAAFAIIIGKDNGSTAGPELYTGNAQEIGVWKSLTERETNSGQFTVNTWVHLCGTWNGTTYPYTALKVYKNGVEITGVGNTNTGSASSDAGIDLHIGAQGNTPAQFFKGLIDDVMIFSKELTPSEVLDIYNNSGTTGTAIAGVQLRLETQGTNTSTQLSWKTASAATTRSMGIDYSTKGFEIGPNTASVNAWMHTITPALEIGANGFVGICGCTAGAPVARLDLGTGASSGGLKLGNDTGICVPLRAGTLRYVGGAAPYEYCDGSAWQTF